MATPPNVRLDARPKIIKATKPAKPKKAWKTLTANQIRSRLATSVHFSSKPVNTNAHSSGVRLGVDETITLPLIGLVSSSMNRRVVDYQDGAVAGALLSQCASVIEGTVNDSYKDTSAEQVALVQDHAAVLDQHAEVGTHTIDPRLRQVLFPAPSETGYVALTPLHSSVFSIHLKTRLATETQKRTSIQLMIGGSKAQNVGRVPLVGAMQRVLVFDAPQEDSALRAAYALFYKGISIHSLVDRNTLRDLVNHRESHRLSNGRLKSTVELRQEERDIVMRIGREAMSALHAQRAIVEPYVDQLGGWASAHLDEFARALLDEGVRSRTWRYELAQRLLRVVENHKTTKNAKPLAGYGDLLDYLDMLTESLQ